MNFLVHQYEYISMNYFSILNDIIFLIKILLLLILMKQIYIHLIHRQFFLNDEYIWYEHIQINDLKYLILFHYLDKNINYLIITFFINKT